MPRLIVAIVLFAAAGGIFFLYTKPTYDDTQATSAQIDSYNEALDKASQLQQLKQTLLSRYNSFDPNALDRLQKLLPDHVDNIALILDLDSIASRYGLAMQNVQVSGQQTDTSKSPLGAIGSSHQAYDSLTLTFATTGTYANFLQFLTDLESSLRIVDLVSLTIQPASSPTPDRSGQPTYTYNITLRTYWLK